MKKYFLLIAGFAIITLISACSESTEPEGITYKNEIIPLAVGNKWVWNIVNYSPYKVETGTMEILSHEIIDLVGEGIYDMYKTSENGQPSKSAYIVPDDEKIELVDYTSKSPSIYIFTHIRFYPRHPVVGWTDKADDLKYTWRGTETVTVPAGTFDCWYCTSYWEKDKTTTYRYFARKVGLIKQIQYNSSGDVMWKYELKSCKLK